MRRAKVAGDVRAGPADGLGFGQQTHLQGCEIAVPHPLAARLDGRGDGLVGEFFQQACEAIATPCRHDDVGATCGRAADGQQTRVVVTGETLIAAFGIGVEFHVVAHVAQAFLSQAQGRFVAQCAGGGIYVDVHDFSLKRHCRSVGGLVG